MDYVTQQYKLFPNLAACYALRLSADWIWEMYNNVTAELDQGELERLPEVCKDLKFAGRGEATCYLLFTPSNT